MKYRLWKKGGRIAGGKHTATLSRRRDYDEKNGLDESGFLIFTQPVKSALLYGRKKEDKSENFNEDRVGGREADVVQVPNSTIAEHLTCDLRSLSQRW